MKAGFWIGLDRTCDRVIFDEDFMTMENFMQKYGVDQRDLVGPFDDKEHCEKTRDVIVKCALIYLHGSNNFDFITAISKASSFELFGLSAGDICGKLNYDLCSFHILIDEQHLPTFPEGQKAGEYSIK